MMTLPKIAVTATTDSGQATSAFSKGKGLSTDFLALLGETLGQQLTLASGKTVSLAQLTQSASAKTTDAEGANTPASLSALLEELGSETEGDAQSLLALLGAKTAALATRGEGATATDTATTTTEESSALSDQQVSALSALFAMLPQQTQVATPQAKSADEVTAEATDSDAKLTTSLASILSTKSAGTAAKTHATDSGSDKQSDKATAVSSQQTSAQNAFNPMAAQADVNTSAQAALENADIKTDKLASAVSQATSQHSATASVFSSTNVLQPQSTAQVVAPATAQINSQLGTSEWQQNIGQQITLFTRNGQQNAELRLHPEELGAVQISLKLEDSQAQIHMVSAHSHVRAALEAALPTLRTQLAESGIQLGQSSISSDSFAGQQQQQFSQQSNGSSSNQNGFMADNSDDQAIIAPVSLTATGSGNNAIDIFA
ncbi:flagellar hook-length control protein FliK [Mangrovibacter sp. SLW1]